ncbi:hypothetical protein IMG5_055100 [Ichthyophthirius multifiliis]|uniref:Uncharacterized protein n=1 Tax=Ichthyophthirius multifiliis TaxID=5932 RepID=G0QN38_ICHMU|nr:hypothetical protein IMG5_055100 [Ichthyophthirius multifiliis]EGR33367.1 hypothetical protein IMG5_055100 [Ichthyophthirius multifiliis]|eukprot:XP_004037353.1 hypothetical protein IMG5_055100 [Ichthyophthirius multifiliis]
MYQICEQVGQVKSLSELQSQIVQQVVVLTKSCGFQSDQDFDFMTAQFARNFTHAVKNIDIFYNSIDFNSDNTIYNNLSPKDQKSQDLQNDEQFEKILNMINKKNKNISGILRDESNDEEAQKFQCIQIDQKNIQINVN